MEIGPARVLQRALLGLVLALVAASSALAAPALWAVKDRDSTIYLFGTMHVLTPEADWRTPAFDSALRSASVIWFETDIESASAAIGPLLVRYGFDAKTPLKAKVSATTMTAVREALKGLPGGGGGAVEIMQPWTAGMLIQSIPAMRAGLKAETGADMTLNREARGGRQPVRYLETVEAQIRVLATLSQAEQVEFLEDSLKGLDTAGGESREMQDGWVNGDVQLYGSALLADMRDERPALYDALIRKRNRAWVDVLAREMRGSGVQIVNVGALHLVGEDGLIAQLRRRGYRVERIQ